MVGIVQLARTTDKAKALAAGHLGEYTYESSMDKGLFAFLGIDSKEFLEVVKNAKIDSEIENFAYRFVAKKDPKAIDDFNKRWLAEVPTGESLTHFNELRLKVAPDRTDVTTWADILDLEEGRHVSKGARCDRAPFLFSM